MGIEELCRSLTTRRRRGSRHLNRLCMCFCIMASRITLDGIRREQSVSEVAIKEAARSIGRRKEAGGGLAYVEKDGRRRMRLSSGWSPSWSYPLWRRFGAAIAALAVAGTIVHGFLCAKVSESEKRREIRAE